MEDEIRELFERAGEAETPAEEPSEAETEEVPAGAAGEAEEAAGEVSAEVPAADAAADPAAESAAKERDAAVISYAIRCAARDSRDPEVVAWLLGRGELRLEDGEVSGLDEAVASLRRDRPYLFPDAGGRPRFAAAVAPRAVSDDEAVEGKYRGNPWFRRK